MACKYIYKGKEYSEQEFHDYVLDNIVKKSPENQFLGLLAKDNNWVTFFIKSIISDSAKKGYEKVLFPTGNTAAKVEGHQTLEDFKKQKEDRIRRLKEENIKFNDLLKRYETDNNVFDELPTTPATTRGAIKANENEVIQLKQELERVEKEGFGALKPIFKFYEENVKNILKKNYQVNEVKDEYGNTWHEITITSEIKDSMIVLKQSFTNDHTVWNKEQEVNYIQDRLPKIPVDDLEIFKRIKGIQDNSIQGVFYNAAIYLYNFAQKGAGYHEAFHAVFRLYTTVKQRMALYAEALKKYSADEIAKKVVELKKSHPDLTDERLDYLALEELMADEFMNYVISNGAKEVRGKIGAFFKRLLDFIKGIFGKRLTLNELFDNINTGVYQNNPIQRNVDKFKDKKAYRTVEGFTVPEQKRRINSLNYRVFAALSNLKKKGVIEDYEQITSAQLTSIYEEIKKAYEDIIKTYKGQEARKKVLDNWEEVVKLSKESFEQLGYTINDESIDSVTDDDNVQSQEGKEKIYGKNFFEENLKNSLYKEIKLYLKFIPKTTAEGAYLKDDLGDLQFVDFNDIYSYLAKNLSDLSSLEDMITELKELVLIKPELQRVIKDLTNEATSESFKNAFFTTFSKQAINFITLTEEGFEGTKTYKAFETNRRNLQREILGEWKENYLTPERNAVTKFDTISGKILISTGKATELLNSVENIIKTASKNKNKVADKDVAILHRILADIGISMSLEVLKAETKDSAFFGTYLTGSKSIQTLLSSLSKGIDIFSIEPEFDKLSEASTLLKLAKLETKGRIDGTVGSFVNGEGNMVYSINLNTAISKQFKKVKDESTYKGEIESYFADASFAPTQDGQYNNRLLQLLYTDKEARNNFKWFVFDTERLDIAGRKGTAYAELSDYEWLKTKLNLLLNNGNKYGYHSFTTPADKSNTLFVYLPKAELGEAETEVYKLFMQEVGNIKQAQKEINTLPEDELIERFHYVGKNKKAGNGEAFKFQIFKRLNESLIGEEGLPELFTSEQESLIKEELNRWFDVKVNNNIKAFKDTGIISEVEGKLINNDIDLAAVNKFKGSIENLIKHYTLNTILGYNGITALTSINQSFYKSIDDHTKRIGLWQTPGTDIGDDGYVSIAVVDDIEATKDNYDEEVYNDLREGLIATGTSIKEADEILAPYKETNQTDAQGYTTLARHIDVMKRQGQWTLKHNKALEALNTGTSTAQELSILLSPVKGTYVGKRTLSNGRVVPVLVKYSSVPLIKATTKKYPTLDALREHMEVNAIDEVVFKSAWKVAPQAVGDIKDLSTLKPISISNSNYRIPQIIPYKESNPIFASQPRKHILSNINPKDTYKLDNKSVKGSDIIKEYNAMIVQNIIDDYNKTVNKLELNSLDTIKKLKEKLPLAENKDEIAKAIVSEKTKLNKAIQDFLLSEIKKRNNLPDNYHKALDLDTKGDFKLPLDFPVFSQKYENMFTSAFRSGVTLQKMPGYMGVNVSDYGYTKLTTKGKIATSLRYTFPEFDDEGNMTNASSAEFIVSQDYFINEFKKRGLTIPEEGIQLKDIPNELRYFIAYRVPNQGKNFMTVGYIKDILPKESPSQIIGPKELTKQMGLDFDIDKLFVMMYEFETNKDGDMKMINYTDGSSRAQRNNRIIDIFRSILSSPNHFKELVSPNTVKSLKQAEKTILEATKPKNIGKDWYDENYKNEERRINLAGKQLMGFYSIKVAAQSSIQILNPTLKGIGIKFNNQYFNHLTGLKQDFKDDLGDYITDNYAELQTAAVDNAKDPILGKLNDNIYVAGIRSLLTGLGVNLQTSSLYLSQPILQEFSKIYADEGSTTTAARKAIQEVHTRYVSKLKELKQDNAYNFELNSEVYNFDNEELLYSLNQLGSSTEDIQFYEQQLKVLDTFIAYKEMSLSHDLAIRAIGADSLRNNSTLADNEAWIEMLDSALASNQINITDVFLDIEESPLPQIKAFTEKAITEPTVMLNNFFAWGTPAFRTIRKRIKDEFGTKLGAEKIKEINYQLFNYSFSDASSPVYITREKKDSLLVGKNSLAYRLKEFKEQELKKLESNPSYDINKFTSNLYSSFAKKKDEPNLIKFNNTNGSFTADQKTELQDSWLELYNNEASHSLAKDLVLYSVINNGFAKGPNSFIELVPVEIWETLGITEWYNNYRTNFNKPEFFGDNFIQQYIRNAGYKDDFLVPQIKYSSKAKQYLNAKALDKEANQFEINVLNNPEFLVNKDKKGNLNPKPFVKLYSFKTKTTRLYKFSGWLENEQSPRMLYTKIDLLGDRNILRYNASDEELGESYKKIKANIEIDDIRTVNIDYEEVKKESKQLTTKEASILEIDFEEEQSTGYRERTIKNASADATIAIAVDFTSAGERLTKSSVLGQNKKYIPIDANSLDVTKERVDKIVEQLNSINKSDVKGINIFSKSDDKLGKRLTNPNWYAKDLMDVEAPYKANASKIKAPQLNPEEALKYDMNLMYKLQVQKFQKNPELIDEINERGGLQFILNSEHTVGIRNSRWEGKGENSNFIKVLAQSYTTVAKGLSKFQDNKQTKGITLNIAGNGIYTMKGKYTQQQVDDFTYKLLKAVTESPNLKTKIESIRSGGQTGFDEAGAKAGISLGIPTKILAPKGWKFRDITGKDISDEKAFKARFKSVMFQLEKPVYTKEWIEEQLKAVKGIQFRTEGIYIVKKYLNEARKKIVEINKAFGAKVLQEQKRGIEQTYIKINEPVLLAQGETQQAPDIQLEEALKKIIVGLGLKVESYDILTNRLGTDVKGAADILRKIIYISEAKRDLHTLPEEVSHFFIEALGEEHPLVKKLLDDVVGTETYKEVVKNYSERYNNSERLLKKEAVGQLLSKAIVDKWQETKPGLLATIKRLIDRILQLFKKARVEDIDNEIESIYGKLASQILVGDVSSVVYKEFGENTIMYQLGRNLQTIKEINDDKTKALSARIAKYKAKSQTSGSAQQAEIAEGLEKLLVKISDLDEESKFIELLTQANIDLGKIKERLDNKDFTPSSLARAKEMVSAYAEMDNFIEDTNTVLKREAVELESLRKDIEALLNGVQEDLLANTIFELSSNPTKDIDTILLSQKDISWDQAKLGALSNVDDTFLANIDKLFKTEVVDKTREESIEFNNELDKLTEKVIKFQKAKGIKGNLFDFMVARDAKGKRTGNFTSKYSTGYWIRFFDAVKQKEDETDIAFKTRKKTFFRENNKPQLAYGEKTEAKDMWIDDNYKLIHTKGNEVLKEFYDFVIKSKAKADDLIPVNFRSKTRIPSFKKELIDIIREQGLVAGFKGLGSSFKDAFVYEEELNPDKIVRDESGNVVEFIPVRGTKRLKESEMSFDIPKVLHAYYHMSLLYKHKSEVKDLIDLAKDYIQNRDVPIVLGNGKVKVDKYGKAYTKKGVESNAYKRFEDWYNMIFLDKKEKDEGYFQIGDTKVGKRKVANALMNYGSLKALAFNLFSGFNNVTYGGAMQVIEAAGGEFYNLKEYGWATKQYTKEITTYWKKDSKLRLALEYFDTLQDQSELATGRRTTNDILSKFGDIRNTLFIFNKAGEHMMQSRILLAMMKREKIWDAYEVKDGKFQLKDKAHKIADTKYRSQFVNLVKGVNQRIHGRYTEEERAAISQYALGAMAMQFRKWMHSGYESRFRKQYFDERLQRDVKGRYLSYVPLVKALIAYKGNLLKGWKTMSAIDKANMRRNIAELSYAIGVIILSSALQSIGDDDDDLKHNKAFNFFRYQADRFNNELFFYVSLPAALKIVQSPAASISTVQSLIKLGYDVSKFPFQEDEKNYYQRGPQKGKLKIQKDIEDLMPIVKEANRWRSLVDEIKFGGW